ncbi:hypothetical protein FB567DRAFT_612014 [Paraphoma chrysanthemicola]|uniref:F-box domain-containing protein n=1 Tax=Paraphoma chrysanthemicola TaxID=798071 RepID=A0A8K0QWX9_9PLEO|nr:hypothetical protein FB567DRAFT_612014 [Paraphoma chrysanthemicola]
MLNLPPEVRNRIYDIALSVNDASDAAVLRSPSFDDSFYKLTQVCRLLRAEFRPLYYRRAVFSTDFEYLPGLLVTLFDPILGRSTASIVRVAMDNTAVPRMGELDLFALLRAKALSRDVRWEFFVTTGGRLSAENERRDHVFKSTALAHFRETLDRITNKSTRRFLSCFSSGLITGVSVHHGSFQFSDGDGWMWRLTARKKHGISSKHEGDDMSHCCEVLAGWPLARRRGRFMWPLPAVVHVQVEDSEGIVIEKYRQIGTNLRMLSDGTILYIIRLSPGER